MGAFLSMQKYIGKNEHSYWKVNVFRLHVGNDKDVKETCDTEKEVINSTH